MRDIDPNFDPALHTLTDSSYFEDMSVGQRFVIPSRTLGDANFAAFQLASGDNHPIHYDVEYCRKKGSSAYAGSWVPDRDSDSSWSGHAATRT